VHSNGFSLVRKILSDRGFALSDRPDVLPEKSLGETLLTPTQIYVKPILAARKAGLEIHGMAHVTGGGLPENLPRCLGPGQSVQVDPTSWTIPPVFQWIAAEGGVSPAGMFNTFNMGVGFVVLVPPAQVDSILSWFQSQEIAAFVIGKVVAGDGKLIGLPE